MNHQVITKLAPATFRSEWVGVENSRLKLNFNPLIEHNELSGQFCLVHWQAKPKGLRRWGVYDSTSDDYFPVDWDKLRFNSSQLRALQVDERFIKTVPTAVICLDGVTAKISEGIVWLN